jgi:hypothetical protein
MVCPLRLILFGKCGSDAPVQPLDYLKQRRRRPLTLRSELGEIELAVD